MTDAELQECRDFVACLRQLQVESHAGTDYLIDLDAGRDCPTLDECEVAGIVCRAKALMPQLLAEVERLRGEQTLREVMEEGWERACELRQEDTQLFGRRLRELQAEIERLRTQKGQTP